MPENVVRSLGAALSNWLAPQGFASVLCSGFIPEPIVAPTAGPIVFYALFQPWGYELSQMTFLRDGVAGVLADSEWATEKWRRWLPPPVSHVPTYLEPEQFALRNQNLPETPVRIAVGGTLQPRKRQREAILAVRSLIARGHDIELRIYGYDLAMMAEYTAALRALASSPGLKGKVYFRGLVDITELVEENHVVLMTSIDESMPQTLLIAMAAGLIPVACPSGGIPEVVIEGETGFLAKGFDVAEIEGALERALAARSQWSQIRATARDLLAREYSSVPVSRKLIETLFEGLQIALSPGRRAFSASAGVDTPTSILGHFGGKTTTASRDGLTGTIWLKERVKGILGPSRSARVATMLTKLRRMARTSRPD
jgi:glycosyltransferase involved in cell wall biosynthesis